jgi:hypothetical protein
VDPRKLIEVLLSEVAKRCPDNLCDDDVTVLLMRANGRTKCSTFRDRLGAAIRFIRLLVGAINPSAERPPFPDANLANVGGAVIPALGRRWRAVRSDPNQAVADRALERRGL